MFLNPFRFFVSFFTFFALYAVDPENSVTQPEDETKTDDEPVSLADEVLKDFENAEETEPEQQEQEEQKDEDAPKPEEAEQKPEGEEKKELSDADFDSSDIKNPNTKERFEKLRDIYKETKGELDTLRSENESYKQSFNELRNLGFTDEAAAEDLINFASYRNVIANGDAEQFKQIIEQQIQQFEELHGKRVSVSASIIDTYKDIREKVDALELDPDDALEIARARRARERLSREQETVNIQTQNAQQQEIVLNKAIDEVSRFDEAMKRSDPDFNAIKEKLKPFLPRIAKEYPPEKWLSTIQLQYETIKQSFESGRGGNIEPLRSNGNKQGSPAPKNLQDAVLQDFGFN